MYYIFSSLSQLDIFAMCIIGIKCFTMVRSLIIFYLTEQDMLWKYYWCAMFAGKKDRAYLLELEAHLRCPSPDIQG